METFPLKTFTDLLRLIGKKPGIYLAPDMSGKCRSIRELCSFISGFEAGQHLQADSGILAEFTFWICHRRGVPDGARNWYGHILEHAGGDEEAAFRLFFDYFEQYLIEREKIGPEAIKARFMAMLEQMHEE